MKPVQIPNKLYFRIGEVAYLLGVKPYVLRYWETEFPDIKPSKSKSGQRLYKRRDVELLVQIKQLLYQEKFTINGARKRLKELSREQRSETGPQMPLQLQEKEAASAERRGGDVNGGREGSLASKRVTDPPADRSQAKIFAKIRKDLEAVLVSLKD